MDKRTTENLISKYKMYLRLERSLSANTIAAYLDDLAKLLRFLDEEGLDVLGVTYEDLQQLVAELHDIGIHPRSQARIISGIKSFYKFLLIDGYIQADPTELLETPKVGVKLPEILSVEEIDRILASIDLTTAEGQRNRAMLEVLYSCGLRVSELVSLRIPDIYPNEEFIRVEGKVPLLSGRAGCKAGRGGYSFPQPARCPVDTRDGLPHHQATSRIGRYP